jgi:uncharacterized protein YqeY
MGLMQSIQDDLKAAMKSQDKVRTGALRMLLSDLKYAKAAVSMAEELPDAEVIKVVQAYHKKLEKSLGDFPEGDARQALEAEIKIIAEYVPQKASREQVAQAVDAVLASTAERQFGAVMKLVMAQLGSAGDGKVVSEILKAKLG